MRDHHDRCLHLPPPWLPIGEGADLDCYRDPQALNPGRRFGSVTVLIGHKPAARLGDMTAHGGAIVIGCPTVLIGDAAGAAVLAAAAAIGAPFCECPND